MRPIAGFAHLMSSTVMVQPLTGRDSYGAPTYGLTTPYKAHIARNTTLSDGTVTTIADIWLNTKDVIEPTSLLTLSTEDTGSTESYEVHPRITGVERRNDRFGPHSTMLHVNFFPRRP